MVKVGVLVNVTVIVGDEVNVGVGVFVRVCVFVGVLVGVGVGFAYIIMLLEVPFMDEFTESAAVTVHVPAALKVTLKTFTPASWVLKV